MIVSLVGRTTRGSSSGPAGRKPLGIRLESVMRDHREFFQIPRHAWPLARKKRAE